MTGVVLAAVFTLAQGAGAMPYGRVAGQVVEQGQNTPIEAARINLISAGRPATLPPPMFETTTDADGRVGLRAARRLQDSSE
jgi:hypothetical protein